MVHVLVGLVYCEIIYISCVLTKENKRIALRNSNTKTVFQRFMENTWATTWSLNSVFKRSGVDLVTTMTSLMKKTVVNLSMYIINFVHSHFLCLQGVYMGNSSSTASERLTLEFCRRERRSRPESFLGAVCRRRCLRSHHWIQ